MPVYRFSFPAEATGKAFEVRTLAGVVVDTVAAGASSGSVSTVVAASGQGATVVSSVLDVGSYVAVASDERVFFSASAPGVLDVPASLDEIPDTYGKPAVTAKRVAAYRGNPALGQTPIVMDTPPTVTMTQGATSPRATPVTLAHSTTAVSKRRGRYGAQTVSSNTYQQNYINNPSTSRAQGEVEFDYTGDGFDIKFHNSIAGVTGVRIFVNEQLASDTTYATAGGSTTGPFWATVAFATTATRRLRIELVGGALFGGLTIDSGDSVVPIPTRLPKCAVLGDSWVGGAGSIPDKQLLYSILGTELGWETARLGQGGSGYDQVGTGSGVEYGNAGRISEIVSYSPDFAVIIGSINDNGHDATAVGVKAAALYAALAAQSPQTKLYVVGPQRLDGVNDVSTLANRDAIKAAAQAAPNVVAFIDPIAAEWITEANKTTYMLLEGASYSHLNVDGHLYWSRRLATEILRVGSSVALPLEQ